MTTASLRQLARMVLSQDCMLLTKLMAVRASKFCSSRQVLAQSRVALATAVACFTSLSASMRQQAK